MEHYRERLTVHLEQVQRLKKTFNRLSFARLLAISGAITSGYFMISQSGLVQTILFIFCLTGFILLMRLHQSVKKQLKLARTLAQINEEELAYLTENKLPFADGNDLIDEHHPYTYDLDIFGQQSLYQHLNRTKTDPGKKALAAALLKRAPNQIIRKRQEAIAELTPLLEWRQLFTAKALLANDSEKITETLRKWNGEQQGIGTPIVILSYLLPVLGGGLTLWGTLVGFDSLSLKLLGLIFTLNLIVLARFIKRMNAEIGFAEKINQTLLHYSELFRLFEEHSWKSPLLQELHGKLTGKQSASQSVHRLSRIFASLESLQNGFGAILFNGTLLFHLHTYRKLIGWKKTHVENLPAWIDFIGETEMLLSLANLAGNNPEFCFPEITEQPELQFKELGHPMIAAKRRITNTVDFTDHPFIILTGSNMSGKSTFLRTLGVNMILSNAGSVICASEARVFPMDVLVSMRLSDSLTDNESYFFAEVKRLGEIMRVAKQQRCFVLLDELLRGTNSDDKRSGTIAVVRKLAEGNAIGVIATHDLEVCQTTDEYPQKLVNKCFEVTIESNELKFDYLLRDGICRNKSATFLMRQMGII